MKRFNDAVTLGLGALGVAMFSLGFSVTGVACNARPDAERSREVRQLTSERTATTLTAHEVKTAAAESPAPLAPPAPPEVKAVSTGALSVKRLVVTERIVGREPAPVETLSAGHGPIYAFAELENASPRNQKITITFEHEGSGLSVGHAELEVPAYRPRFRTWGNTRNIREPGRWQAVVRAEDGRELARTEFDVQGS
jgi:hypothetical protein